MTPATDCLVLRIDETDKHGEVDHTLYVLYDSYEEVYLIRGKRSNFRGQTPRMYSFESYSSRAVRNFISVIIPQESVCVYELYRYADLPADCHEIDFATLTAGRNILNELVAYTNQTSTNKLLRTIISSLRDVSNEYTPDEFWEEG